MSELYIYPSENDYESDYSYNLYSYLSNSFIL